ncbi:MAG: MXAN_6577-like cysteine-rich protein [Polyangiaceae bacterium]
MNERMYATGQVLAAIAFAGLAIAGCSSSSTQEPASSSGEAIGYAGTLSSSEILGAVTCGGTVTADYTGSLSYEAYSFAGTADEAVTIAVTGSTNTASEAWLLRSDFTVLASAGFVTSTTLIATLPRTETYYVAFKNRCRGPETFTVSLSCGCTEDAGLGDSGSGGQDSGPADSGPTCASGQSLCGSTCVNESNDPNNCGACGTTCAAGEVCSSGACACPSGESLCGTTCVNESSDPNNCGACGATCAAGQTCSSGACACASGESLCSGACVSESSDPNNCGACGNACQSTQTCSAGVCTPSEPPTNGLVAYYPFDGNTNDVIGGADGVASNLSYTTDRFGNAGSAGLFTATGTFSGTQVVAPSNGALPTGSAPRTISAWLIDEPNTNTPTWAYRSVWGYGTNTQGERFGLSVLANTTSGVDNPLFTGQSADVQSNTNLLDSKWHNVVIVYDGTTISLFLDNALNVSAADGLNTIGQVLNIGKAPEVASEYWGGTLDDLRIYNRVLSTQEIGLLYAEGGY